MSKENNTTTDDGTSKFFGVRLRPCGVYGEEDPWYLVGILRNAKAGLLNFQVGSGSNKLEHMYVLWKS